MPLVLTVGIPFGVFPPGEVHVPATWILAGAVACDCAVKAWLMVPGCFLQELQEQGDLPLLEQQSLISGTLGVVWHSQQGLPFGSAVSAPA
jgi:hypothetical protein